MTQWSARYIGLPYAELGRTAAGVDCWGLAHLVFDEVAGIDLASYSDGYAGWQERAEINGLIGAAKASPFWNLVDTKRLRVQPLDLAVFRTGRLDTHIGIVVQPASMLHIVEHRPSCIEGYAHGLWASRLTGIWRHVGMEGRAP